MPGQGRRLVVVAVFSASGLAAGVVLVAAAPSDCFEKAERGAGLDSVAGAAAASGLAGGAATGVVGVAGFTSAGAVVLAGAGAGFESAV